MLAEIEPVFTQSPQSVTGSCNQDGEVIEILSSPSSYHSNDSISSDETNRLVAASFSDKESDDSTETLNNLTESSVPKEDSSGDCVGPSSQHTEHTELTSTIQFCVTEPPEPCITFDIGNLLSPTKSIHDKCEAINSLSNAEKYSYIFKHISPPKTLPTTYSHGCNHKFKITWIKRYPWLLYSTKLDGIFCGPCAITLPVHSRYDKGILVNKPFNNWVKISQTLSSHSKLVYHRDCVQAADALKDAITN